VETVWRCRYKSLRRLLGVSGVRVSFVAEAKVLEWRVDDKEERMEEA